MPDEIARCICASCSQEMENLLPENGFDPDGGLAFYAPERSGSSFANSMSIVVALCRGCLKIAREQQAIYRAECKPRVPTFKVWK